MIDKMQELINKHNELNTTLHQHLIAVAEALKVIHLKIEQLEKI